MDRKILISELKKSGIKVVNGKVKKSDIKAYLETIGVEKIKVKSIREAIDRNVDEAHGRILDAVTDSPAYADKYYEDDEAVQDIFFDLKVKIDTDGILEVIKWLKKEYKFDATPYILGKDMIIASYPMKTVVANMALEEFIKRITPILKKYKDKENYCAVISVAVGNAATMVDLYPTLKDTTVLDENGKVITYEGKDTPKKHLVVKIDDKVLDFTMGQFRPDAPFPLITVSNSEEYKKYYASAKDADKYFNSVFTVELGMEIYRKMLEVLE